MTSAGDKRKHGEIGRPEAARYDKTFVSARQFEKVDATLTTLGAATRIAEGGHGSSVVAVSPRGTLVLVVRNRVRAELCGLLDQNLTTAGFRPNSLRWGNEKARICGPFYDGASRARTGDLLGAIQALSQLSYSPGRADCS
jgi:hypothetical protein